MNCFQTKPMDSIKEEIREKIDLEENFLLSVQSGIEEEETKR
jgi:hypothetical protein